MLLNGLQTNTAWGNADYALIRPRLDQPPLFQSAKLYQIAGCHHNESEIAHLKGLGITHFVLRLSDTIYEPDAQHAFKWRRDPVGYAEDCLRLISRFAQVGVLDYIVSNEDNILWTLMGYSPTEYADYMRTFIDHIRTRKMRDGFDLPDGVRLGLPPIAFTDEYPHMPYLNALSVVAPSFDFCAVHSYWQSSRQGRTNILAGPLRWQRFGANYEFYQTAFPGMPIMVTEWGNSIHEQGVWTPQQVNAFRAEQYPIWLEYANAAGVEACHVFISAGSTPDWTGFRVTPTVAHAMSHAIKHLPAFPVPPQNRVLGEGRIIT